MRSPSPTDSTRAVVVTLVAALTCALLAGTTPRPAQAGPIEWRGLLDMVGAEWSPVTAQNTLTRGDSPYDAYRLRLFADATVNDHLQILSQAVYADTPGPYLDGIYGSYTPWPGRDAHVQFGKVPWPIGTWAPRTYSNVNPLLSAPLMYQYHSTLLWYDLPDSRTELLGAAGSGETGVHYGAESYGVGMPIVDDSYWDVGVVANGSQRPLEYAFGVTMGAPSWASTGHDDNPGKSMLGRIGLVPLPWLRLGVSGAYAPYLAAWLSHALPAGKSIDDYHQVLGMADLGIQSGHLELEAEGADNTWQTPVVGNLHVRSGYVEAKYQLMPGLYAAGRYDVERFDRIQDALGDDVPWDADVTRIETGVGYRFTRGALGKLVYQNDQLDYGTPGRTNPTHSAIAAQLSIGF